ncbi:MAG: hypothetical protein ACRCYY_07810 [Trueperaceae bacterium]
MKPPANIISALNGYQRGALIVGVIGLILTAVGAFTQPDFFQSYLFGFLFWIGLSLGCLILLFVQYMAGGSWGAMIKKPLEAGAMVLPVMAIFFIPVLIALFMSRSAESTLYPWMNADYLASHPLVAAKTQYLNLPFFLIRSVIYFAIWILGALYFFRKSNQQDAEAQNASRIGLRLKSLGAVWVIIYILTMTFAGIDWAMSLTPEFFSGMFPVIMMIGQAISAMCLMIFTATFFARNDDDYSDTLEKKRNILGGGNRLQDLGNFLMAFTMFWTYVSMSQLMIIWSNNIIETNPYFVLRLNAGWRGVMGFLLLFGFFVPFVILFSRWVKRKRRALFIVACWAFFMRLVDLFVIIIPNYRREGLVVHWLDLAVLAGIGGIWFAVYSGILKSRPILPVNDPRLAEHDNHHQAHGHAAAAHD